MRLNRLYTMLAAGVSVTFASAAYAATWDVATDFNEPGSAWTYGTCAVANVGGVSVNTYAFNADTYSAATFGGGSWAGSGATWAKSAVGNTEWNDNGEPLAWISVLRSANANPWIFTTLGVWVQPYAIGVTGPDHGIIGDATVIRWTAPESGTFNLTGSVLDVNSAGLVNEVIKTATDGSRTVVHSIVGSPLALNATDTIVGSVSLQAGETLDLISYQSPAHLRTYGVVDLQISSVPEPASMGLLGLGAVALLRRHRRH